MKDFIFWQAALAFALGYFIGDLLARLICPEIVRAVDRLKAWAYWRFR